jgi:hypothetical protein
LRRLQIAFVISFAAFLIGSVLIYNYGINTIIAVQNRFGWPVESTYAIGLLPILPTVIIGILIRRIPCEQCGGRVIRTLGSIFPKKCASCGAPLSH